MKINQKTANSIVVELSKVIEQHINLMDENGIIISSTDKKRLGTFHSGAKRIIDEHLDELIIYKDGEPEGAKKGLNLPIEIRGKYVGVVGITGEYKEVKKYGYIIKKMTEILLLDDEIKEQNRLEKSARNRFVREWLLNKADVSDEYFIKQARALDIDLDSNWQIIVLTAVGKIKTDSIERIKQIKDIEAIVRSVFDDKNILFLSNGEKYILMIPNIKYEILIDKLKYLSKEILNKTNLELRIGLSRENTKAKSARNAYLKCEKALKMAIVNNNDNPVIYDDLDLEIIINNLEDENKKEFINRVFKNCTEEEIENYKTILNVFYASDCSLQSASERLFIHKNTLQYKLNKLSEKTGIDPRSTKGITLYTLALNFIDS